MKTKMTIISMLVIFTMQAQNIERSVISSFGMSYSGPSYKVDGTTGETVISTGTGSGIIITQGFIQPPMDVTCTGDFDSNGVVNIVDLLIFTSGFGCAINCGITDMDENGVVNIVDLLIFSAVFGTVCP